MNYDWGVRAREESRKGFETGVAILCPIHWRPMSPSYWNNACECPHGLPVDDMDAVRERIWRTHGIPISVLVGLSPLPERVTRGKRAD